jgi:hypothetical protein
MTDWNPSVNGQQYDWENQGSITTQQDALGVDKSAATVDALVDAKKIIYEIENGTIAVEIRFKGNMTNGQSNVINMCSMRGVADDYIPIATLTLVAGTQTDGTNLYVDTIEETVPFEWLSNVEIMSNGDNGIARLAINTHGHSRFLFLATTLNSTSLLVDIARTQ